MSNLNSCDFFIQDKDTPLAVEYAILKVEILGRVGLYILYAACYGIDIFKGAMGNTTNMQTLMWQLKNGLAT